MGTAPPHMKALYYHCELNRVHAARQSWILESKPINVDTMIQQWKLKIVRHLERISKFGGLIPGKFQTRNYTLANSQYIRYKAISKRLQPIWRAESHQDLNLAP
ncbi:hypothetical protein DSO57_1028018 [Entomophthora muscae]|uniref:Uncharacterized protein n=1 Tax=Entomophthora muscae TaxID=34485 RepID=A0ACC2U0L9_9FUNG|nr:hypothetical protein DSO57_1028018 [Entomophthora muscae]